MKKDDLAELSVLSSPSKKVVAYKSPISQVKSYSPIQLTFYILKFLVSIFKNVCVSASFS